MAEHRFQRVRLLSPLGGESGYAGGQVGYLEVSAKGLEFWSHYGAPRISVPWSETSWVEAMGPHTARQRVTDSHLTLDGVEANFWTALPQDCSFLFLCPADGAITVFLLPGVPAPRLQVRLMPFAAQVQDPQAPTADAMVSESASSGGHDAQAPLSYDLTEWTNHEREAFARELVTMEIPHGWADATLNVPVDAREAVDDMVQAHQTAPTGSPPVPATVVEASTEDQGAAVGLSEMSERLKLLERLVAMRDAGGLTPGEFDAARNRVAQHVVEDKL